MTSVPISPTLETINLTLVYYTKGDYLGLLLGYLTLSPLAILVSYLSIFLARREWSTLLMLLGQLLNELLNYILKKSLKEPRPTDYLGKGYGMPSSHAMFCAYLAFYAALYLWLRLPSQNFFVKSSITISLYFWTFLVCYSRVYLNYHTITQVIIGFSCGSLFGLIWFYFLENFFYSSYFFKWLKHSSLCKKLYIRDSRDIENIWLREFELCLIEKERQKILKKE